MTGSNLYPLLAFIAFDILVIMPLLVGAFVDGNWNPIAEKYPPVPCKADAVQRRFQSFAVGSLSLGFCIHVAADEACLHLYPCWFARRVRARPASIPWNKIELSRALGKYATARLTELPSINLRGPRWCLELAPASPQSP